MGISVERIIPQKLIRMAEGFRRVFRAIRVPSSGLGELDTENTEDTGGNR